MITILETPKSAIYDYLESTEALYVSAESDRETIGYQWYKSLNKTEWTVVVGANSSKYIPLSNDPGISYYKCSISDTDEIKETIYCWVRIREKSLNTISEANLAYILDYRDLTTKGILQISAYEFSDDIEYNEKSTITLSEKPDIADDDFVLCKNGYSLEYIGICENFSSTDEDEGYDVTLQQKECLFDREIFKENEEIISQTGIEDFIVDAVTRNWINTGDALMDRTYMSIEALTHTPINTTIDDEDREVYNLKTFLANAKEFYHVFLNYSFVNLFGDRSLAIQVYVDRNPEWPIDINVSDVTSYKETYEVDVLAKLNMRWKSNDGTENDDYSELAYGELTGSFTPTISTEVEDETQYLPISFDPSIDTLEAIIETPTADVTLFGSANSYVRYVASTNSLEFTYLINGLANTKTVEIQNGQEQHIYFGSIGRVLYQDGESMLNEADVPDQESFNLTIGMAGLFKKLIVTKGEKSYTIKPYIRMVDEVYGIEADGQSSFVEVANMSGSMIGKTRDISYFLLNDRTITRDIEDENRAPGVTKSIYVTCETADDMWQKVRNEFTSNSYEHKISFDLLKTSRIYPIKDYYVGRRSKIKTKTEVKSSIITKMVLSSESAFAAIEFGKLKITLIDKIRDISKRRK